MQDGNSSERGARSERGPSAAAAGHFDEREMILGSKGDEYKSVQMKIMTLEADLARGNERASMEKNPDAQKLAIAIGRELHREIEMLMGTKEQLEDQIRGLGGDPSKYTIQ